MKLITLKEWWEEFNERFWVTDVESAGYQLTGEKIVPGFFPENRNFVNLVRNFLLAIRVILIQKPNVVVSLGAGIAVPFFVVAKLFGIKTIFIETFVLIARPTLTGKILYHFADVFIIQNRELKKRYPRAIMLEWIL